MMFDVCEPTSRDIGAANPEPRNRQRRPHRRVDESGRIYEFVAELAYYWQIKDERHHKDHRAAYFVTEGKQVVIHYTCQCTAYRDYDYNMILTLDLNELLEVSKPRGFWQRLFKPSVDSFLHNRVLNKIPSSARPYVRNVLRSFVFGEEQTVIRIE